LTEKPKLLWHSNAGWAPTGYGQQTGLFTPLLNDHYDVRVSAFYGLEGAPIIWEGVKHLPGLGGGSYGNEAIPAHAEQFFGHPRDGLVVTLLDVWVLDSAMCSQFDMACWTPVDHQPAPPRVRAFFHGSQAIPLAMSQFGMEQLAAFDPIYVPHGIDTSIYQPMGKELARQKLGMPKDGFVVGMVAANKGNPSRKSFVAALQAFARLREKHDDAILYLHTDVDGQFSSGVPLTPVIDALGIPNDAIKTVGLYHTYFQPLPPKVMAYVYSSMDVLLNPATGEGFGIPVVEAQACGTPAIVTDFSAMSELCGAGWKVGGSSYWTPQQAWQMLPDVADISTALEHAYCMPTSAKEALSQQAVDHAVQYDAQHVLNEYMLPALEQVKERYADRRPMKVAA
jgi:glycosyltransferase involved in cell wall biosynthesis